MKPRELEWLQDTKSTLHHRLHLALLPKVSACLYNQGHLWTLCEIRKPSHRLIFCSNLPAYIRNSNPNPALPSLSESRTRLEGLKNTGMKHLVFIPELSSCNPGPAHHTACSTRSRASSMCNCSTIHVQEFENPFEFSKCHESAVR